MAINCIPVSLCYAHSQK